MVLVQNKIDLSYISMVSRESVQQLSKRLDLPLFVTSAKKNINIDEGNYFHLLFNKVTGSPFAFSFSHPPFMLMLLFFLSFISQVFYFLAKSYLRSLEGSFDDLDSFVRIEKPISLVRTSKWLFLEERMMQIGHLAIEFTLPLSLAFHLAWAIFLCPYHCLSSSTFLSCPSHVVYLICDPPQLG